MADPPTGARDDAQAKEDERAPSAAGTFAKTPPSHLLIYARERSLTGTFDFRTKDERATITVERGRIKKLKTSAPVAYLGTVLYEQGAIDDQKLNDTLLEIATRKVLHGQVLLSRRSITPEQHEAAMREQARRKLRHIFLLGPDTNFAYFDNYDALKNYGGDDWPLIETLAVAWRGIRESASEPHVRATLERVGKRACLLAANTKLDAMELSADERAAADCLRMKAMTLVEFCGLNLVTPRIAELLVYFFVVTKLVELKDPTATRTNSSARNWTSPTPPPVSVRDRVPTPGSRPIPIVADEYKRRVSFNLRAAVPVTITTPTSGIAAQTAPKPKSDPAVVKNPSSASLSGVRSVPGSEAHARTTVPATPQGPTRDQIVARAKAIADEDYFAALELPRQSSIEQARMAYFRLAKVWHPDKLPPELADLRPQSSHVFRYMSDAHATLVDPDKRRKYLAFIDTNATTAPPGAVEGLSDDEKTNFQNAEMALARKEFERAETLCRAAHQSNPRKVEYLALLAWIESMRAENQSLEGTRACIEKLDMAVDLNGQYEKALFYRAKLHDRAGNAAAAFRDYRRVVALNPNNIDAAREVRLQQMRGGRSGSDEHDLGDVKKGERKDSAPRKISGLFDFNKKS